MQQREAKRWKYGAPGGQHDDCVILRNCISGHVAMAITWDSLQVQERRFEGVVIEGEDPVEEIDKDNRLFDRFDL